MNIPLTEYKEYFPHYTPSCFQQDLIENTVTDIETWRETLFFWAGSGHQPRNVLGMLEYYDKLKKQPTGDWIGDAVRTHSDKDTRLVEIAVIQVLVNRFHRNATDQIKHVNYFKPEIEHICGTAAVSSPFIDAVLQRRREQFRSI